MTTGDVHWVNLPGLGGHTQQGRRPSIVLQSMAATSKLPTIIVIPLTSQLSALRFPRTTLITANDQNGLTQDSVALVFQLTAVDKTLLAERLGAVSKPVMQSLWTAFDDITERRVER